MHSLTIVIEKPVMKFLTMHSDIRKRFLEKVRIMESDFHSSLLDIRPLIWTTDRFRLRIGKYRFLFRKDETVIVIYFYDADSRGGVYK